MWVYVNKTLKFEGWFGAWLNSVKLRIQKKLYWFLPYPERKCKFVDYINLFIYWLSLFILLFYHFLSIPSLGAFSPHAFISKCSNFNSGIFLILFMVFCYVQLKLNYNSTTARRRILKPAHLALARLSVVAGSGKMKGQPIIDDYIVMMEPVQSWFDSIPHFILFYFILFCCFVNLHCNNLHQRVCIVYCRFPLTILLVSSLDKNKFLQAGGEEAIITITTFI